MDVVLITNEAVDSSFKQEPGNLYINMAYDHVIGVPLLIWQIIGFR